MNRFHGLNRKLILGTVTLFALLGYQVVAENSLIKISDFSSGNLEYWTPKIFKGETRYYIVETKNRKILQAKSNGTASGLYRKVRIDLDKTPYLNWSWRIDNMLGELNEQSKNGDDYAARIYVIVSGGLAFWRTRALNYVWAGSSPRGSNWPNAFAGENAVMLAIRSKENPIGVWYSEKRHVQSDLKKYFGENIRYIDSVAIMTDTDNSGTQATAYYGEIYFSAK